MLTFNSCKALVLALVGSYLLSTTLLHAAEPQEESSLGDLKFYDVEIVVFKNISVPRGEEINLPTPSPIRSANTLDLSDHASINLATDMGFSALRVDELRLSEVVQSIIKSSRYGLLTHTGWRQPGLDQADSFPIWIKGGKIFGVGYSSIDHVGNEGQLPAATLTTQELNLSESESVSAQQGLYELEGQIIITLSRYLHTQANLVLRKPSQLDTQAQLSAATAEAGAIEINESYSLYNYGLNEKRRMRSKKLHYLDHPQFGMLVLITPYQKPVETALEVTAEQQNPAPTVPAGSAPTD